MLAIPRKHPDYLAFDLAVKMLGGEGANRLHNVLRSERGLTYGASADTEARKQAGDFVAETDTRTETTGEVLRLMVDEFSRLQRERPFERELSGAQAYLAGSFPLTIETPNDIATEVLNVLFYELPVEEIGTFPRARAGGDAGRHPARGAAVRAAGPAVDRARRQRGGIHPAAEAGSASTTSRSSRSKSSTSCRRRCGANSAGRSAELDSPAPAGAGSTYCQSERAGFSRPAMSYVDEVGAGSPVSAGERSGCDRRC